jgi:hypothetical protein
MNKFVKGYHWFIFGACIGGLVVNSMHTPTITQAQAQPVKVAEERVVKPVPPIHELLASMPLNIRVMHEVPPVPKRKPNLALQEAGLM